MPEFEELRNYPSFYSVISGNINIEERTEPRIGSGLDSYYNCSFLYLTNVSNNITVIKCADVYEKEEISRIGNRIILSEFYCKYYNNDGEWRCYNASFEPLFTNPKYFLDKLLNIRSTDIIYNKNWTINVNNRIAYCYNMTLLHNNTSESSWWYVTIRDVTFYIGRYSENITVCLDEVTKFPVLVEMETESEKRDMGSVYKYKIRYELNNLTENPSYEYVKNMLKLPGRLLIFIEKSDVKVYSNSLTIFTDVNILEKIEKVRLNNFVLKDCTKTGNSIIVCNINETVRQYIKWFKDIFFIIEIFTENYIYYINRLNYTFYE